MRNIVLLTLFLLVFIVILHTTRGYYETEENDPFYKMLLFRGGQNKVKKTTKKGNDGTTTSKSKKGKSENSNSKKSKSENSKKTTKAEKKKTTKKPKKGDKSKSTKKTNKPKNNGKSEKTKSTKKTTKKPKNNEKSKNDEKSKDNEKSKKPKSTKKTTEKSKNKENSKKSKSAKKTPKKPKKNGKSKKTKSTAKTIKSTNLQTTKHYDFPAMFPPLNNYEVDATPVSESKYPWVARVVHSRTQDSPFMCSASCINNAIFITAARCLLTTKVAYTSVKYQGRRFPALAFLTPTKPTAQAYDDIGFIVVNSEGFKKQWKTVGIQLIDVKRKDTKFKWFSDLKLSAETDKNKFKVVGYAGKKYYTKMTPPDLPQYSLSELDIKVSREICAKVLHRDEVHGFEVPCYMSCTVKQYLEKQDKVVKNPDCLKYHGVEGGAIINVKTNKLLGVATWGVPTDNAPIPMIDYPVGFSVPNSQNFIDDYACAKKIRDSGKKTGSFQNLC